MSEKKPEWLKVYDVTNGVEKCVVQEFSNNVRGYCSKCDSVMFCRAGKDNICVLCSGLLSRVFVEDKGKGDLK